MNFVVLSRSRAGREAPEQLHATISITDPRSQEASLVVSENRVGVLRLSFDDTGDYGQPLRGATLFDAEHAQEILNFADRHRRSVDCFVVHCEAGASRSPAVAAALSRLLGGDDAPFFANFSPNRWVFRELLELAEKRHWPRGEALIGDVIAPIEPISLGRSGVLVARLATERGNFIRKSGNGELIGREAGVLTALSGITSLAPEFTGRDGAAFFQTELPGTPLSTAIHEAPEKIARLFGEVLRAVHALTPPLVPDPRDEWTRFQRNEGLAVLPPVFSHGDWCLPNVLTDGEKITGIVDWADGGWRDPRIDLGTGLWTLRYNLNGPNSIVESEFLAGYGFGGNSEELEPFVKLYEGN
jgi:aminoglycoside phosphotransferase